MLGPLSNTIQGVVNSTWPMIIISVVILVSCRLCYLLKKHEHIVLYKELLMLSFIIYILCLFQVVTFNVDVTWSGNNFIPFKEIFRYSFGSRLFFKNVLGNMIMFLPFGLFISYYLQNKKPHLTIVLATIASFSIEFVQLLIGRVFDIDDIILNIMGGYLGYLIYYVLSQLGEKMPNVLKKEWFLNIISVIILIGIITLL